MNGDGNVANGQENGISNGSHSSEKGTSNGVANGHKSPPKMKNGTTTKKDIAAELFGVRYIRCCNFDIVCYCYAV